MDFISHALWGGISLGRKNRRAYLLAVGISLLPDILTEGLFSILYLLNIGGMPGWENGHPNITDYPLWAQYLYDITHSFVIFALIFALFWIIIKRPLWVLAAWGLHILIDIPMHTLALFPTPFLWPISDIRINGLDWSNPFILATNIILLATAYFFWLSRKFIRKSK